MTERSLRIAMVAPPWFEVPPAGYGGIESICAYLVDALVDRGHYVILFSAGKTTTEPTVHVRTFSEPQAERVGHVVPEVLTATTVDRHLEKFALDVVHDHTLTGPLTAPHRRAPSAITVHGPLDPEITTYYRMLRGDFGLVAISAAQRAAAPDLPWLATVHNAVPVRRFAVQADKEDFALFLGRCCPDKGLDVAIDVARRAKLPLVIGAKCREKQEQRYFDTHIKPRLGAGVEWRGEVRSQEKLDLLRRARCLLFPIQWEEPFGLVMIEALASGTPVVATRRGSVPEVIRHGVTGLIADDVDDLPALLHEVVEIDSDACRSDAEERFDVPVMAAGYERAYLRLRTFPLDGLPELVDPIASVPPQAGPGQLTDRLGNHPD